MKELIITIALCEAFSENPWTMLLGTNAIKERHIEKAIKTISKAIEENNPRAKTPEA